MTIPQLSLNNGRVIAGGADPADKKGFISDRNDITFHSIFNVLLRQSAGLISLPVLDVASAT